MPQHIVLAYSGGLDTSVAVHWLKHHFHAKVTAVLVDLGQPITGIEEAQARAIQNGAEDCLVIDAKAEFADAFVAPAIQANALYEDAYPLATALGRPLIAKCLVDVAQQVGAGAIAHGCTGKGNDQVRIEAAVKALAPGMECIAPQRSHPMSRDEVLRYAAKHDLALPSLKDNPYSIDENLYGRSCEGHDVEDPVSPVPETAYAWTVSPQTAPDQSATVTITFEAGVPTGLDGHALPLWHTITRLNDWAGQHGLGRIDHVENRLVGIKTREVYEAPAAIVILAAKKALEGLCLTRDEVGLKTQMEAHFAQATYDGKWFHPAMAAVQAFVRTVQAHTTGTVTLQAYKGNLTVLSRSSPLSLFQEDLATYTDADAFHHQAAEGFIELWSLPMEVATKVRGAHDPALGMQRASTPKLEPASKAADQEPVPWP